MTRKASHRAIALVLLALVVGFGIRAANVLLWRPSEVPPVGATSYTPKNPDALVLGGDALYYHEQANALADGDGYVDPYRWRNLHGDVRPSATHPPAYGTYLALWSLMGVRSMTGHRMASALLGLVTIAALAAAARRMAGDTAMVVTAFAAAVYPGFWINDTMLLSEVMAQAAVACFLYAMVRVWERATWQWVAAAGLAAGVATMTRNEQIVLYAVLLGILLFRRGEGAPADWGARLRYTAVAAAAGLTLITPWVVRNLVTFQRTTILTSATGAALSAASCDETYYGEMLGWYHDCFKGPFPDKSVDANGLPIEVDSRGREIDESVRDVEPMAQAEKYIRSHLGRLPVVVAARVGRLWGWFRPAQTTGFEIRVESRGAWQSWFALGSLYVLEIAGVVGLMVMWRRRLPVAAVVALVGVATFGAAITFGVARYRSTAEVALLLAATVGLTLLFTDGWGSRSSPEPSPEPLSEPSSSPAERS